jgi:hypothetical protein
MILSRMNSDQRVGMKVAGDVCRTRVARAGCRMKVAGEMVAGVMVARVIVARVNVAR